MTLKMTVSLIAEADFEEIQALVGQHYWENFDFNFSPGYWIPSRLLKTVPGHEAKIKPFIELPNLPIFYGGIPVDWPAYSESITCLCRCREDGSEIKGVSILPPYWYEAQAFEFKRCFRYHEPNDPERYWRIISRKTDIDWLLCYWDEQSGFFTWQNQIQ
jgi:hypothetical protein